MLLIIFRGSRAQHVQMTDRRLNSRARWQVSRRVAIFHGRQSPRRMVTIPNWEMDLRPLGRGMPSAENFWNFFDSRALRCRTDIRRINVGGDAVRGLRGKDSSCTLEPIPGRIAT